MLRAGETSLATVADSTVVTIERHGQHEQWKVHVVTADGQEHNLDISADGRQVLDNSGTHHHSHSADRAKHNKLVHTAELDYRAAIQQITATVDGTITKLHLNFQDGTTVRQANLVDGSGTQHRVTIDAVTGKVLSDRAGSSTARPRPTAGTPHHPDAPHQSHHHR
ncbi:MAG: PepSY domain-containing protein [Microlunatus sp.]|nr:PepSY domain-containing protein [Microlunatus sp.]